MKAAKRKTFLFNVQKSLVMFKNGGEI